MIPSPCKQRFAHVKLYMEPKRYECAVKAHAACLLTEAAECCSKYVVPDASRHRELQKSVSLAKAS